MASTLSIDIVKFVLDFTLLNSPDIFNPTRNATPLVISQPMPNGTGLNQADVLYGDERTLTAAANETLDLTALIDMFGAAITLVRIKLLLLYIPYLLGGGSSIQVGGAASNPFVAHLGGTAPTFQVRNGGMVPFFAPDATAYLLGTGKNLKVLNNDGANPVTYRLVIVGASV